MQRAAAPPPPGTQLRACMPSCPHLAPSAGQEFDVDPRRTVREEFYSVYAQQRALLEEQARLSAALEDVGEDMERMQVCAVREVQRRPVQCRPVQRSGKKTP
jgi:hypothetical protein